MTDYEVVKKYYDLARAATLRQLKALSSDTLEWQPRRGCAPIGWFFAQCAVFEDVEINGRFTHNWVLPKEVIDMVKSRKNIQFSRNTLPSKTELERFLHGLKKQTDRFFKALIEGDSEAHFYKKRHGEKTVDATVRKVVFHEITNLGHIQAFLSLYSSENKKK